MAHWVFDTSHSSISFSVRHLMISKVRGRFGAWRGTFDYDEADPTRSRVEVHIDAASVDTQEAKRDAHLRSPDFLDVETHPELTFVSRSIERDGAELVVHGDLTIRGVTRPVDLMVESLGRTKDPWGGERVGFAARATIDRHEFGLDWNQALEAGGVIVGAKVEIEIDIEAINAAAQQAA